MGRAVGRVHDELALVQATQQREQQSCGRRSVGGNRQGAGQASGDGKGRVAVGFGADHRVVVSTGGRGLVKNGTRFTQSFAACQWMRAMTPRVISG